EEHVVRPLDPGPEPGLLLDGRRDRGARDERELRHRARRERGPEHDRAVEVQPRRRVPLPAEPAPPGGLALGDDRRALGRAAAREVARHALGRVDLLEPVHAPPRAPALRCELRGAGAVGHGCGSTFRHSTPSGRPGRAARALRTAAATSPPASARWLSLMRMASSSPRRWFVPPPVRTAHLARARIPGSVLRVSRTTSGVPRTRST